MDTYSPPHSGDTGVLQDLGIATRTGDLVDAVKAGLPVRTFRAVADALGVSDAELARVAGISGTTLTRRKRTGSLSPEESDRVLRIARLLARSAEAFGSSDAAAAWLKEPNLALGGATPLAYAETEVGAREVENLIGRLEHGVYS
jgi:putative toxin-antitoxin system antitoxin component (TIGR02293 family)